MLCTTLNVLGGLFQLYLIDSVKKRQESGGRERSGEDIQATIIKGPLFLDFNSEKSGGKFTPKYVSLNLCISTLSLVSG